MKRRDFLITSIAGIAGTILGAKTKALAKTIQAAGLDVVLIHLENLSIDTSFVFYETSGYFNPKTPGIKIECRGDFSVHGPEATDKIIQAFEDNRLVDFVFEKDARVLRGKCHITSIGVTAPIDKEVTIWGTVSSHGPVVSTTKNGLITDFPLLAWK